MSRAVHQREHPVRAPRFRGPRVEMRAYLLLTNGLRAPGELSQSSCRRLEKLLELWDGTSWIIVSTGYTQHRRPFLDDFGFPITEAEVAAKTLLRHGVPRDLVLTEEISADTIGNIYFSLSLFVQPLQIRELVVVTSAFHMQRTRAVAEWLTSLEGWEVVPRLHFEAAQDPDLPTATWEMLKKKEAHGCENAKKASKKLRSREEMCLWIQREHAAYNIGGKVEDLPEPLREVY